MDIESIKSIGLPALGAFGGGGLLLWFSKLMGSRLIKQYDQKHDDHEHEMKKIREKFGEAINDLKVQIARLEPLAVSAAQFRTDMKEVEKKISVVEHRVDEHDEDLKFAHKKLKVFESHYPITLKGD
jgi:predicted  nucleic acid-binding Zn-ribbon protein